MDLKRGEPPGISEAYGIGLLARRDRATLGEALSRDFTPGQAPRDEKNRHDTDA